MTLAVSTLDGDTTKVEDDELEELRAQLSGEVLTAADEGFVANPIYNAMHDRRPALKVRATGTADVVDTINFARQRNLLVVRGGGHSVAGLSACDGGLVIDPADAGGHGRPRGSAGISARRGPVAGRRPGVRRSGSSYPVAWSPRRAWRGSPSAAARDGCGASTGSPSTACVLPRSCAPTGPSTWRPRTRTRTSSGRCVVAGTSGW